MEIPSDSKGRQWLSTVIPLCNYMNLAYWLTAEKGAAKREQANSTLACVLSNFIRCLGFLQDMEDGEKTAKASIRKQRPRAKVKTSRDGLRKPCSMSLIQYIHAS